MTEEPPDPPGFLGNQITRVDVSQSDIRPLARAQLQEIRDGARGAAARVSDPVTRMHLEDIVARVDRILESNRNGP